MKRRIKVFLIVLFNLILITELVMPTKIYAATNSNVKTNSLNGWVKEYDNYYYYQNDVKLRGWQKLDGNWYFFDESGAMATGWLVNDGKIYYLDEFGVMQTGWMTIEGERYFFSVTGAMQRGFKSISETTYYFDREGRMKIGWQEIDGNKFYFDNTGAMLTGSQEINGYSYVFNYDGVLISEPKTLNTSLNANIEDNVGAIEWTFDSSLLSQWRNTDFPISIYISDATTARCNGEQMSLKGNHEFVYYAPENGEYTIEYENESGKTSLAGTITVRNIDKTPVRFTDFSDDISIEVNSFPYRINITDQADHDGVSCVAQNGISVTIDGTPLTNFGYATYSDGTGYIDCPRAGHYEFTVVDAAGNTARLHATLSLATSNNDNVPPAIYVVEAPSNEWSNQDKLVKFTVTDNVAVDTVSIQTSAESKVLARHADGTYSCYLQGNGVYTLVAKDTNGNQSTLDVNCQKIDKVPPSFSNVQDGKTYSNTSAFPVLYSDNASGIAGTPVVYDIAWLPTSL